MLQMGMAKQNAPMMEEFLRVLTKSGSKLQVSMPRWVMSVQPVPLVTNPNLLQTGVEFHRMPPGSPRKARDLHPVSGEFSPPRDSGS